MRARQRDAPLIDDMIGTFLVMPFWVGPIVAAVSFAVMRWFVPWALSGEHNPEDNVGRVAWPLISQFSAAIAPWFSLLVVLAWVMAEFRKWTDRGRLDRQTNLGSIQSLDWREFEFLLSEAFRRQGFFVEHSGRSGPDGGVDQRLSKAGAITLVQCKHWQNSSVGVKVVRELLGVVTSEKAHSGIVVTAGTFTSDAIEFAARNPIRLIDGRELECMIREVQTNPRPEPAKFSLTSTAPSCPKCGAAMKLRTARRGNNAGNQFWGCSNYPKCNGTRDRTRADQTVT